MNYFNKNNLIKSSGLISLFLIWFIIYQLKIYNALLIPAPNAVFDIIIKFFSDINFIYNFLTTFIRIIIAFLVSAILGIFLGLLFGYYKILNNLTESLIDFIRSIPGITLFPLFILFFGVGDISRLMVAIFIATPIILINTKYGVIYSNNLRKNLRKIYKINWLKMFTQIILPEASPYVFNGIRISLSLTIIIIIATEMMLGTKYGLGQLIITSQYQFETEVLFAVIILLGTLGFILNLSLNKLETKIFHWKN